MVLNIRRRRDVKRAIHRRCWLNGVEITNDCWYVDVRRGVVRVYLRDETGHFFIRDGEAATAERRGRVVLRKKAA